MNIHEHLKFINCIDFEERLPEDNVNISKRVGELYPIDIIVNITHLRQECHNSKFGIFELLV